jgi:GNAT superfamily N-acetyltransferase
MFTVRRLTQHDIDFVMELTAQERWGYLSCDVERCIECEPEGCFIAESEGKAVGHVFSISYGRTGWIGLLIVHQDHRGHGVGTMLMNSAINHLQNIGVETIRLEAVPKALTLYQRLGFVEEFDSLRFSKELKKEPSQPQDVNEDIHRAERRDINELARFDSRYFGVNRHKVLERIYTDYPQNCLITEEKKKVTGYIMARETSRGYWVGPWVCDPESPNVAKKLILSFLDILDKKAELKVGMPALNVVGMRLMKSLGFKLTSRSIRMLRGAHKYSGNAEGVYGIAGPEKG